MSRLAAKQVLSRNFYKSAPISQTLTSSYYNLMEFMANSAAQQKFNQAMESFLKTYYPSNNSCDISLTFPPESLQCESSSATNACAETPICLKDKSVADKQRYKTMRQWKHVKKGKNYRRRARKAVRTHYTMFPEKLASNSEESFILRLLSFNILAQYLLETYPFLYKEHDKWALYWNIRRQLLLQEIIEAQANVSLPNE